MRLEKKVLHRRASILKPVATVALDVAPVRKFVDAGVTKALFA